MRNVLRSFLICAALVTITSGCNDGASSEPVGDEPMSLGRISYWFGKINLHKPVDGNWMHDDDCTSGALEMPLDYCNKFFPGSSRAIREAPTPKPPGAWLDQFCQGGSNGDGTDDYVCAK